MAVLHRLLLLSGLLVASAPSSYILTSVRHVRDPNRDEVNAPTGHAQEDTEDRSTATGGSVQNPMHSIQQARAAEDRNLDIAYPVQSEAHSNVEAMRAQCEHADGWLKLHRINEKTINVCYKSFDPTTRTVKPQQVNAVGDLEQEMQGATRLEMRSTLQKVPVNVPRWSNRRAAKSTTVNLWPHGVIPYEIDRVFSSPKINLIRKAMRVWESTTCISFVEREPQHRTFIRFTSLPCGYCSFVGRNYTGSALMVSIAPSCKRVGKVLHELGHVMGFYHEQSRSDRDDYVEILWDNIRPEALVNFEKTLDARIGSLGEPYDYDSIMHYHGAAYAKPGENETIRPKKCCPRPRIGQRVKPSPSDIRRVNKLYNCPSCGHTLMEYSGTFSPPQTAHMRQTAEVSERQNKKQNSTEKAGKSQKTEELFCQWRIIANRGEHIRLNFTHMEMTAFTDHFESDEQSVVISRDDSQRCVMEYVEVRDGYYSESPLIGRYCGTNLPQMLVSVGPRMLIEYRRSTGKSSTGFVANYHRP